MKQSIKPLFFLFFWTLIFFSSLFPRNPLDERIRYVPNEIRDLAVIQSIPGAYNDPGSLYFTFSVRDSRKRNLFFFSRENFVFSVGNREVKNILFQNSYENYKVYIPRLPYQTKNGRYNLSVKIVSGEQVRLNFVRKNFIDYASPSINLILVVDTSSSMYVNDQPNYRQRAIRHVLEYARASGTIEKFSLVRFSSSAQTLIPLTGIGNLPLLEQALGLIDANGETSIGEGLDKAFDEAQKTDRKKKTVVILLTDGENTAPYSRNHIRFKDLRCPIYTIGLKQNVNNQFLSEIASSTGGEYYKIFDSFKIQKIYSEIIHKELNKKIFLSAEVTLGPGRATNIPFLPDRTMNKINIVSFWDSKGGLLGTGEGLTPQNRSASSNYQFFDLKDLKNRVYHFILKNESGRPNQVLLLGFVNTALNINPFLPKGVFYLGEPVEFSVLAFQDDAPLASSDILVRISGREKTHTLRLFDDGLHNDGAKSDGLYKNYFFTDRADDYRARYSVKGKNLYQESFSRQFEKGFTVLDRVNRMVDITPLKVEFPETGSAVRCYQSFELSASSKKPLSIKIFPYNFFSSYDTKGLAAEVSIKPDFFILEGGLKKLFNVWVRIQEQESSGLYRGHLILMAENDFFDLPLKLDYRKYKILENEELIRP